MDWYTVDKDYINYLKQFDSTVPNIEYQNRMKCFLGVLIRSDDIDYFAPVTSYKPKFTRMSNDLDFYKIVNKETGKIYGAIDINNMIPVPQGSYMKLTYDNIGNFRTFENSKEKRSYWRLLNIESRCIDERTVLNCAEKLYHFIEQNPNSRIAERCCDFKMLEEKCREYEKDKNLETEEYLEEDLEMEM